MFPRCDARIALQPLQVKRPAGFRTSAGLAFAAKGLHTNHRADDVAVDVDVADMCAGDDEIDGFIDA